MTSSVASPVLVPVVPVASSVPATETAVVAPAPAAELRSYDSEAAFNRAMPRIAGVSEETLLPFNRDVVTIVNVVLRAVPILLTHLPALHETYVAFDDERLTGLTDAANALHHAHHTLESSLKGSDELAQIFPRCSTLRDNMIYDINGLVRRLIVKKGLLTDLRGPYGYAEVASDLSRMVAIYREVGEAATGYRGVPPAEVDEAHALADKLRFLVAHREKAEAGQAERSRVRHQAYTLVLRDYDYVRRLLDTVFFIRGKGDIDAIAPSAHATRGSKGSKKAGEEKVEPTKGEETEGKVAGPTDGSTPTPAPEPQDETTGFVPAGTNIPAGLRAPFGGLPRPAPDDDAPL